VCTGGTGGCINSASGRAVMGWFPAGKRGLAISLRVAAVPLGGAVGAAVLPPLAVTGGFRWAFAFLTACCLLATMAVARWLQDPAAGPDPGAWRAGTSGRAQPAAPLGYLAGRGRVVDGPPGGRHRRTLVTVYGWWP
jgi:MFS family permease